MEQIEKAASNAGIEFLSKELVFSTREVVAKLKNGVKKNEPYNVLIMQQRLDQGKIISIEELEKIKKLAPELKILLCVSDNEKGSKYLEELFGIGIYTAFYSSEGSMNTVIPLIQHGRTLTEAQEYYGIPEDSYLIREKTGYIEPERLNRNLMLIKRAETSEDIRSVLDRMKKMLSPLELLYVIRHLREDDLKKAFFCPNMGIFFDTKRYKEDKEEVENGNFFVKRFLKKELIISDYVLEPEELTQRIKMIQKNTLKRHEKKVEQVDQANVLVDTKEESIAESEITAQNETEKIVTENLVQEKEKDKIEPSETFKEDNEQCDEDKDPVHDDVNEESELTQEFKIENKDDVLSLLRNSFPDETVDAMLGLLQKNVQSKQEESEINQELDGINTEIVKESVNMENGPETKTASSGNEEFKKVLVSKKDNQNSSSGNKPNITTLDLSHEENEKDRVSEVDSVEKKQNKGNAKTKQRNSKDTKTAQEKSVISKKEQENELMPNEKSKNSDDTNAKKQQHVSQDSTNGPDNLENDLTNVKDVRGVKEDRKVNVASKKSISFSNLKIGNEKRGQEFLVINTSRDAGASTMTLVLAHTYQQMYPEKSVCICTNETNFKEYASSMGEFASDTEKLTINNIDFYQNQSYNFLEKKAMYDAVFVDFGNLDNLHKDFYTKRLIFVTKGSQKYYPGLEKLLDFVQEEKISDVSLIVNMNEFLPEKEREIRQRLGMRKKIINVGHLKASFKPLSKLEPLLRV